MPYIQDKNQLPSKGKGSKLSPLMERFCSEYVIDLCGAEAVRRAGYKSRNPHKHAAQLLNHPLVKERIDEYMKDKQIRNELTADYVLMSIQEIVENTKEGNPQAALRGLELLGKNLGLYTDKQEISGPNGEAIKMEQQIKENVADFKSKLDRLAKRNGTNGVIEFPDRRGDEGA